MKYMGNLIKKHRNNLINVGITFGILIGLLIIIAFLIIIGKAIYVSLFQKDTELNLSFFFSNWLYIFQLLSYFIGLISFVSVIITLFKYFSDKKQQTSHEKNVKLIRTIHVINAFETNILNNMAQSRKRVKNKYNIEKDKNLILQRLLRKSPTLKDLEKEVGMTFDELKVYLKDIKMYKLNESIQNKIYQYNRFNNVIDSINELEQWSLYIDENLVYYKLVYRETHDDYTKFLDEFKDVLKEANLKYNKYKACHNVYLKMKE